MKIIRFSKLFTIFLYLVTTLLVVYIKATGITLPSSQYEGKHKITVKSYDKPGNKSTTSEKTNKKKGHYFCSIICFTHTTCIFYNIKGIIVGYNYDLQKNGNIFPQMEDILLWYKYDFPIVKCNDFGHR